MLNKNRHACASPDLPPPLPPAVHGADETKLSNRDAGVTSDGNLFFAGSAGASGQSHHRARSAGDEGRPFTQCSYAPLFGGFYFLTTATVEPRGVCLGRALSSVEQIFENE